MSNIYGTAIDQPNIPTWERVARTLAALAMIVAATLWIADVRLRWLGIASGIMFALTGAFGFCPACYLAGRKLST